MMDRSDEEKRLIDKYSRFYRHKQGGIFTQKTRERIITKRGLMGRDKDVSTFWYRQRENVKTALVDLRLFIELAGNKNVNPVVTSEALKPIVHGLLYRPVVYQEEPNRERAELARWFVELGFEYLKQKGVEFPKRDDEVEEALKLASFLATHLEQGGNVEG